MEKNEQVNKRIFLILCIFFIATFIFSGVSAQELPKFQDKYVNDFANLFDSNETSQLKTLLTGVEQNTTAEVVVVTINTTSPATPAQYRTELFNYWKIGKADKDNGLLILYSLAENRIEVETGYGLEGILPDSKLGRMLDDYYVPYRDNGSVTTGIIIFTEQVSGVIKENWKEVYSGQAGGISKNNSEIYVIIFVMIIGFIIIISMFKKMIKSAAPKKCDRDGLMMKYSGIAGGYIIYKCANGHIHKALMGGNPGGFFGGGGFGGGGGGFGGGMSGGGGAGR